MSIYGKENIESQKPYEHYLIKNYWIIAGTLKKDIVGGTFLIIIDARNSKILKITHGKWNSVLQVEMILKDRKISGDFTFVFWNKFYLRWKQLSSSTQLLKVPDVEYYFEKSRKY